MLTAAYFMLRDGVENHDLGPRHFADRDQEQLTQRLLQRLRDLGIAVEVKAALRPTAGVIPAVSP